MPRPSIETRATFGLMLGGAIAGAAAGVVALLGLARNLIFGIEDAPQMRAEDRRA